MEQQVAASGFQPRKSRVIWGQNGVILEIQDFEVEHVMYDIYNIRHAPRIERQFSFVLPFGSIWQLWTNGREAEPPPDVNSRFWHITRVFCQRIDNMQDKPKLVDGKTGTALFISHVEPASKSFPAFSDSAIVHGTF